MIDQHPIQAGVHVVILLVALCYRNHAVCDSSLCNLYLDLVSLQEQHFLSALILFCNSYRLVMWRWRCQIFIILPSIWHPLESQTKMRYSINKAICSFSVLSSGLESLASDQGGGGRGISYA